MPAVAFTMPGDTGDFRAVITVSFDYHTVARGRASYIEQLTLRTAAGRRVATLPESRPVAPSAHRSTATLTFAVAKLPANGTQYSLSVIPIVLNHQTRARIQTSDVLVSVHAWQNS